MTYSEAEMNKKFNKIIIILSIIIGIIILAIVLCSAGVYFTKDSIMASYYYKEGVAEKIRGYPDASREQLEKVIELDTNGKFGKMAENYIDKYLPKSTNISEDAIYLNIQGFRANHYDKDFETAIDYFEQSIEASPEFEWPYSNMAGVYCFQYNEFDKAQKLWEKALKLNPNYINARVSQAKCSFEHGLSLYRDNKYDEAMKMFDKSIEEYEKAEKIDYDESKKFIRKDIADLRSYIELANKRKKETKKIQKK